MQPMHMCAPYALVALTPPFKSQKEQERAWCTHVNLDALMPEGHHTPSSLHKPILQ